jgi:hypothetical protein
MDYILENIGEVKDDVKDLKKSFIPWQK